MSKMKEVMMDIMDLYYEGLSIRDIATQLHVSTSLVKSVVDQNFDSDYNEIYDEYEYSQTQGKDNVSRS